MNPLAVAEFLEDPPLRNLQAGDWTWDEAAGTLIHTSGYGTECLGPRGRWYPTYLGRQVKNSKNRIQGYRKPHRALLVLIEKKFLSDTILG